MKNNVKYRETKENVLLPVQKSTRDQCMVIVGKVSQKLWYAMPQSSLQSMCNWGSTLLVAKMKSSYLWHWILRIPARGWGEHLLYCILGISKQIEVAEIKAEECQCYLWDTAMYKVCYWWYSCEIIQGQKHGICLKSASLAHQSVGKSHRSNFLA